jgi:hypothetical protein
MTTAAPPRDRQVFFYLPDFMGFEAPKWHAKDKDDAESPLVVPDMPVFRSGTFRDSWGEQHTWTEGDIEKLVTNYTQLTSSGIMPHIPVRDGHRSLLGTSGTVVGWHTELKVEERESPIDKTKYKYLLATYEITEPDAAGKIKRGTWRNRSAEIGVYRTNAETTFDPAYMGVAYVDLPAVEGLEGFSLEDQKKFYCFMAERGTLVTGTPSTPPAQPGPSGPAPVPPGGPAPTEPTTTPPGPAPAPPTQAHSFTIGGQTITDFGQVQAHITRLETENSAYAAAQKEATTQNRKDFVAKLVTDKKAHGGQQTVLEEYALRLSPEDYSAWEKTWEVAPTQSVTAQHGASHPNDPTPPGGETGTLKDVELAEQVVKMHERAGMAKDKLYALPSYQTLVTAGKRPKPPTA